MQRFSMTKLVTLLIDGTNYISHYSPFPIFGTIQKSSCSVSFEALISFTGGTRRKEKREVQKDE
jgi:hypothetical protein